MTPADRIAEVPPSTGATCADCGFRYYAHLGHIIACPVCRLAAYESMTGLPDVIPDSPLLSYQLESGKHVVSFEDWLQIRQITELFRNHAVAMKAEFAEYKDTTNMQMAAISTAATSNSRNSVPALQRNHPYWSAPYNDVVTAVAREIRERERARKAEAETVSALCQLADAVLLNGRILAERDAAKDALATARQDERERCEKAIDDAGGDNTQYHINAIRAPTDERQK